ncbi:MAG: nucleotidyl transferase AbiEii/AbiGii toxin family protein [Acidimicrobiia bacterium]
MKRHDVPPPNLASLRARVTNAAAAASLPVGRVQRYVGVAVTAQVFAGVADASGPRFLVKGGSALELRLGLTESRTSKDLDGVFRGDFVDFFSAAVAALRAGWAGFTGRATEPEEIDIPGMRVRPRRFAVKLDFQGRPFITVPVEVAPEEAGIASEYDPVQPADLDGLTVLGLPRPGPVPCITIRWQIAQKLHACTDPLHGTAPNDRARDLPDILILGSLLDHTDVPAVREACEAVFAARERHTWPPVLVVHPHWPTLYTAAISDLDGFPATVDGAADAVRAFIRRVDGAH